MEGIRHILRMQDFDRPFIDEMIRRADERRDLITPSDPHRRALYGRIMFPIFYEASTRTRFSFETAAKMHLGMDTLPTENAREFSSVSKGETLEDSILVLCEMEPNVIVLRHYETGAAREAAAVSSVPIINAGDGTGQHPTQAFLDLYTIKRERGRIDGSTVLIGGDLQYGRTIHSLVYSLAKYDGVRIIGVAPEPLGLPTRLQQHLTEHGVHYSEERRIEDVLPSADVIYWTRIQKERLPGELATQYDDLKRQYVIDEATMRLVRPDAILMHPLPRVGEITRGVDKDARAAYFRQVKNGVYIRAELVRWVVTGE